MITVFIVGDVHNMGNNPVNRKDFFPDTLNNKIEEIVKIVNEEEADAIFFTGDLSHSPDTANQVIKRFGQNLLNLNCPAYTIIGNHDIYGGNLNSTERSKIGILDAFSVINILQNGQKLILEKDGITLQVTGQSFRTDIDTAENKLDFYTVKNEKSDWAMHLVHGFLIDTSLPFSHTSVNEIAEHTEANITVSGHLHYPFYKEVGNKVFFNPGAVGRITASKTELRQPKIVKIEFDKEKFTITDIPLTSAPDFNDVIDRSKLKTEVAEIYKIEDFINSVKSFSDANSLDFVEIVNYISEKENVRDIVKNDVINEIHIAEEDLKNGGEF